MFIYGNNRHSVRRPSNQRSQILAGGCCQTSFKTLNLKHLHHHQTSSQLTRASQPSKMCQIPTIPRMLFHQSTINYSL
jgi:hypothetical protein